MRFSPCLLLTLLCAAPATAAPPKLKPLADARLRFEHVDQAGFARDASAVTARLRAGVEAVSGDWSLLAEGEGNVAINEDYNSSTNGRTLFPIVADPENIELNRLQVQYRGLKGTVLSAGRQRVNMEDQRFVGAVGWRQNEQTFDAVRAEYKGPKGITADLVYAWDVRTIFGITANDLPPGSPVRQSIGGDNVFANAGAVFGPVTIKAFAFLVDQDETGRRQFSSQTYGVRATGAVPLGAKSRIRFAASYARQSDWQDNPNQYSADYWLVEGGPEIADFSLKGGFELLGADGGLPSTSFQTPLATLHKFNGWADKFLVTPPNGLRDLYATAAWKPAKPPLPGLNASVTWHRYTADRGGLHYGNEWNADLGFKVGQIGVLLKYARYRADAFATDTSKFWFQLEWSFK